eukprot:NODE_4637_length_654_cov_274.818030.p2 GENE.NODE_4637_length_654_cov_274.818030~~NODE_4637_length_654_cov_274.818030.p2  ORF type:complete len:138 (-),score=57.18 NODE_4637_length_654_cov_274.818030:136-549(-)
MLELLHKAIDKNTAAARANATRSLQARAVMLTKSMLKLDEDEKKAAADLKGAGSVPLPAAAAKDDVVLHAHSMINSLLKQEHRKFEKARAVKKMELQEVNAALSGLRKADTKAMQRAYNKMEGAIKAVDAQTGNFLH